MIASSCKPKFAGTYALLTQKMATVLRAYASAAATHMQHNALPAGSAHPQRPRLRTPYNIKKSGSLMR